MCGLVHEADGLAFVVGFVAAAVLAFMVSGLFVARRGSVIAFLCCIIALAICTPALVSYLPNTCHLQNMHTPPQLSPSPD